MREEIFRKLIHLSSIWMVIFIQCVDRGTSVVFFALLLAAFFAFEYFRMTHVHFNALMHKHFSFIMREHEIRSDFSLSGLTGSFYFLLSVVLSLLFFDKDIASAAISVMIVSDTAAALVGKRFGRHKILDKSLEGFAAFFVSAFFIILLFNTGLSLGAALLVALLSAAIELVSNKARVNDNLSITLGVGFLIQALL